jgi:hypothetical protein
MVCFINWLSCMALAGMVGWFGLSFLERLALAVLGLLAD